MEAKKKAIEATKIYAGKYGQLLSDKQLFLRLISDKEYRFREIRGYGEKEKSRGEWKRKMRVARAMINNHLIKFGGILMVGVSGSVAAEAAKKGDDIDLVIICRGDEMWWWRLFLRGYIWWQKIPHRRFGKKEKKDEFCFNLWLDENKMEIPKGKQNLKNATDLILMKVILEREGSYQRFLKENRWVKKYLASGYKARLKNKKEKTKVKRQWLKIVVNKVFFWIQYAFMCGKKGKIVKNINEGQAFFHDEN